MLRPVRSWGLLAALVLLSVSSSELDAQIRAGRYRRTIVVNPVPGNPVASGLRLLRGMALVSAPSSTNRWLVMVEPGIYDIEDAQLFMSPFVDVEGSGEDVTLVTGFPTAYGTVVGAADSELRDVSVEHRGGVALATALFNEGDRFSMRNVTCRAENGSTNTTGILNRGHQVKMASVTGRAKASVSPSGIANSGLDTVWTDVHAYATGQEFVYAFFNYGDGSFSNVTVEAEGDVFAGGIRNEGNRHPIFRNVHARAKANGVGQAITNGGGSDAEIHDAIAHGIGGDFGVGVSNQFGEANLVNVRAIAEGGTSAFGVANLYGGAPTLTEVHATATATGGGVGLLTDGPVTSTVNRSTLEGDSRSVEQRIDPASKTLIGASQLVGPASAGSGVLKCVAAYDGGFNPLNAACLP